MNREYLKGYSRELNREMELLVFGHSGMPLLVSVAWLTAAALVSRLRIVLLRLWTATGIPRSVWWSGRSGIRFRVGRG